MTRSEAKAFIESFVKLRELATDEMLEQVPNLLPKYKEGKKFKENERVMHDGKLHRIAHNGLEKIKGSK